MLTVTMVTVIYVLWPFKRLNITGDYYNSHLLRENFGSLNLTNFFLIDNFDKPEFQFQEKQASSPYSTVVDAL